jgi:hypothetical protein
MPASPQLPITRHSPDALDEASSTCTRNPTAGHRPWAPHHLSSRAALCRHAATAQAAAQAAADLARQRGRDGGGQHLARGGGVVGQPKPELVRRQLQLAAPSHLAAPAAVCSMQRFAAFAAPPAFCGAKRCKTLQNAAKRCRLKSKMVAVSAGNPVFGTILQDGTFPYYSCITAVQT